MAFAFLPTELLRDSELWLGEPVLTEAEGVPVYRFPVRLDGVAAPVGRVSLRPLPTWHATHLRGDIGYAIEPAFRGRGFAARAVRLVLPLAVRHGIDVAWITCEPGNPACRRVCEKLGATLVGIEPIPSGDIAYVQGQREKCRYALPLNGGGVPFEFLDPGSLRDGELTVACGCCRFAIPEKAWVPSYDFLLYIDGVDGPVGRVNLRAGDTPWMQAFGGHYGYWVDAEHHGHRYASRAVRMLLPLSRRHGLESVVITNDPANLASRRTCELLGGVLEAICDLPVGCDLYEAGYRQACRWRIPTPAAG